MEAYYLMLKNNQMNSNNILYGKKKKIKKYPSLLLEFQKVMINLLQKLNQFNKSLMIISNKLKKNYLKTTVIFNTLIQNLDMKLKFLMNQFKSQNLRILNSLLQDKDLKDILTKKLKIQLLNQNKQKNLKSNS